MFRLLLLPLLLLAMPCAAQTGAPAPPADQIAEHSRQAQQYLQQHQPAKAIPEFEAIVALAPNDMDSRANLGVLCFFQGDFAKAVSQLQAVVAARPELTRLQALLGIAERRTGDDARGRADLEAVFPHVDDLKLKIQIGRELIESYAGAGDLDKASDTVSGLLRAAPTDPTLLYMAYRIRTDMATEALLGLTLAAPDSAQMHQAMAHELQRTHDLAGTTANLRKALALDSTLPGIHFELAEALHASDDQRLRAEAEQQYRLAVETSPGDTKAITRLGDVEAEKGEMDAAASHYKQALKLAPNSADAKIGLANMFSEKGDAAAAAPLLEQVIAADPSNTLAHFRLSAVYRKLHRPDDVKRELAEYQKYKEMREKMLGIYKEMRMDSPEADDASGSATNVPPNGTSKVQGK